MTCAAWQELILDQESLPEVERQQLREHLANCMDCGAWAKTLGEAEAMLSEQLKSEASSANLGTQVLRAVARERRQRWMASAPELLDGLGWGAVGVLGVALIVFWTNWAKLDNHLVWMGAAAVVGSAGWAGSVIRKEKSEAGLIL